MRYIREPDIGPGTSITSCRLGGVKEISEPHRHKIGVFKIR